MFGNIHRLKLDSWSSFGRLKSGRVTISNMGFSSMLSKSRNPEVHCSSPANKKQACVKLKDQLDYHTHDKAISSLVPAPEVEVQPHCSTAPSNNANLNEAILLCVALGSLYNPTEQKLCIQVSYNCVTILIMSWSLRYWPHQKPKESLEITTGSRKEHNIINITIAYSHLVCDTCTTFMVRFLLWFAAAGLGM